MAEKFYTKKDIVELLHNILTLKYNETESEINELLEEDSKLNLKVPANMIKHGEIHQEIAEISKKYTSYVEFRDYFIKKL